MSGWRDEFLSNIPELDREHKQCLDLTDLLIHSIESNQGEELSMTIFDNLVGNIFKHFSAEELLMKDYSFPLLAEHKKEHKEFIDFISSLRNQILNNEIELTKDIVTKIQVAFSRHILDDDDQFVTFFNERSKS